MLKTGNAAERQNIHATADNPRNCAYHPAAEPALARILMTDGIIGKRDALWLFFTRLAKLAYAVFHNQFKQLGSLNVRPAKKKIQAVKVKMIKQDRVVAGKGNAQGARGATLA